MKKKVKRPIRKPKSLFPKIIFFVALITLIVFVLISPSKKPANDSELASLSLVEAILNFFGITDTSEGNEPTPGSFECTCPLKVYEKNDPKDAVNCVATAIVKVSHCVYDGSLNKPCALKTEDFDPFAFCLSSISDPCNQDGAADIFPSRDACMNAGEKELTYYEASPEGCGTEKIIDGLHDNNIPPINDDRGYEDIDGINYCNIKNTVMKNVKAPCRPSPAPIPPQPSASKIEVEGTCGTASQETCRENKCDLKITCSDGSILLYPGEFCKSSLDHPEDPILN